ncbi:MAG: DUF1013 domain-containing protein [Alphaproteobacteria bacterium]|nr:DUF1013 domain-containing protein [Alphaproteobacteria bacterium]
MATPLMPKATAVWLVENTTLTFRQIAEFCGLHELEIQAIADGEVATGMQGLSPITTHELTADEIKRCEADPDARLVMTPRDLPAPVARQKGPRYTPIAKRQDKPDAIAWLVKTHPELSDAQIAKLVGTTKSTIAKVRDRSHWNMQNIRPRHPLELGLCSSRDLTAAVAAANRKKAKSGGKPAEAAEAPAAPEPAAAEPAPSESTPVVDQPSS